MFTSVISQEPITERPSTTVKRLAETVRRGTKFSTFNTSRLNGLTINASARAAGVSLSTGQRYEKVRKSAEFDSVAQRMQVATKAEVASAMSEIMRNASTEAYKVQAGALLAKLEGYEAPQRSQIEVRQIPASVISWLDSVDAIYVQAEPTEQIAQSAPPKALTDKASS